MKFRHTTLILLVISLLFLLTSCATESSALKTPRLVPHQSLAASTLAINREERSTTKQEYIPIYTFAGDDWQPSWKPKIPPEEVAANSSSKSNSSIAPDTSRYGKLKRQRGFRVQLANVTDEASAKRIEKRANSLFENVYVQFQSPTYKVRAGDYTRRSDADAAANEARRMGFRGAWVVPDQVNIWVGGPPPPKSSVATEAEGTEGTSSKSDAGTDR